MVWGRELLAGHAPSFEAYQAPTQHPLYVALCALLGLRRFGFAQEASPGTNVPDPGYVAVARRGSFAAYARGR